VRTHHVPTTASCPPRPRRSPVEPHASCSRTAWTSLATSSGRSHRRTRKPPSTEDLRPHGGGSLFSGCLPPALMSISSPGL
jgi:hypothetical protein